MSKARQQLEQKIKNLIATQLEIDPATIKPESKFIQDLGADSLDTVELMMNLEEEFNIDIPDDEAEKILTFADALDYIDTLKKK